MHCINRPLLLVPEISSFENIPSYGERIGHGCCHCVQYYHHRLQNFSLTTSVAFVLQHGNEAAGILREAATDTMILSENIWKVNRTPTVKQYGFQNVVSIWVDIWIRNLVNVSICRSVRKPLLADIVDERKGNLEWEIFTKRPGLCIDHSDDENYNIITYWETEVSTVADSTTFIPNVARREVHEKRFIYPVAYFIKVAVVGVGEAENMKAFYVNMLWCKSSTINWNLFKRHYCRIAYSQRSPCQGKESLRQATAGSSLYIRIWVYVRALLTFDL